MLQTQIAEFEIEDPVRSKEDTDLASAPTYKTEIADK